MANHPNRAITPAHRELLSRIQRLQDKDNSNAIHEIDRGPSRLMVIQVTSNGGREITKLRNLIRSGMVRIVPHPSMKDIEALEITDAGRAALGV